jgi:predicted PurR-regulated permease PerM
VVKPLLVRGSTQMPGAVVFFALLGGLAAFGGIGLVLGPLLVSLLVTLLRMFKRDFAVPSEESAAQPV